MPNRFLAVKQSQGHAINSQRYGYYPSATNASLRGSNAATRASVLESTARSGGGVAAGAVTSTLSADPGRHATSTGTGGIGSTLPSRAPARGSGSGSSMSRNVTCGSPGAGAMSVSSGRSPGPPRTAAMRTTRPMCIVSRHVGFGQRRWCAVTLRKRIGHPQPGQLSMACSTRPRTMYGHERSEGTLAAAPGAVRCERSRRARAVVERAASERAARARVGGGVGIARRV